MKNLYSHDKSERFANVVLYTLGIVFVLVTLHTFLNYTNNPQPKEQNGTQTVKSNR
jgi:hypothetical protein